MRQNKHSDMPVTVPHTAPRDYLGTFVAAILLVGAVRFVLTVNGADDSVARWSSMTAVIGVAIVYYGLRTSTHRDRWVVAFALVVPYMIVETSALGFSWFTGTPTIFHSPPYSLGTDLRVHFFGHIAGGISWEPAMVWLALWGVGGLKRRLIRSTSL